MVPEILATILDLVLSALIVCAVAKWFSLKEAAEYLGIGVKSLMARCKGSEITYCRAGNRGRRGQGEYRFQKEWLDAYIDSITVIAKHAVDDRTKSKAKKIALAKVFIDPRECGNPFE